MRNYLQIVEKENNCFCKERCCLCHNWFDAADNINECENGYVCYDCYAKYKNKRRLK